MTRPAFVWGMDFSHCVNVADGVYMQQNWCCLFLKLLRLPPVMICFELCLQFNNFQNTITQNHCEWLKHLKKC